jgi:hypothetical protein
VELEENFFRTRGQEVGLNEAQRNTMLDFVRNATYPNGLRVFENEDRYRPVALNRESAAQILNYEVCDRTLQGENPSSRSGGALHCD